MNRLTFALVLAILLAACTGTVPPVTAVPTATPTEGGELVEPTAIPSPTPTMVPTDVPTAEPTQTITDNRISVVITIDDGWDPQAFDQMLTILGESGAHATFFLISRAAQQSLGSQRMIELAQGGHEIAYHSVNHGEMEEMSSWSAEQWNQDYQEWRQDMEELLPPEYQNAIRPYARPPYGLRTPGFSEFCGRAGLSCWWWNAGPDTLNRSFPIKDGDIFLFHVRQSDLDVFESLLIRSDEFRFLSIGEFLGERKSIAEDGNCPSWLVDDPSLSPLVDLGRYEIVQAHSWEVYESPALDSPS